MEEIVDRPAEDQIEKKRNQFLSLKTKIEILNKLNAGVRPIHISNEYGIALSTISRLKKCKTSLREAMNIYHNNSDRRSLRGTFHPKMETALHKWYIEQNENGVTVTGSMLRLKAREFNQKIKENDLEFRASPGWMDKFKKRYGIRLKSSRGERQTTDNIAFEFDDGAEDGHSKLNSEIKSEDILYEPAFVTVDDHLNMDSKNELSGQDKGGYLKMMHCVDELLQWSADNQIEALYLTMLKSLRERIRYQSRQ